MDLLGSWFFLSPFVFNNICSLLAGGLAYRDVYAAEVFTRLLYGFWFLHDTSLSFAVFFAGLRLVRILSTHLQKFSQSGPRYAAVKTGIFKVTKEENQSSFSILSKVAPPPHIDLTTRTDSNDCGNYHCVPDDVCKFFAALRYPP